MNTVPRSIDSCMVFMIVIIYITANAVSERERDCHKFEEESNRAIWYREGVKVILNGYWWTYSKGLTNSTR